MPMKAIPRNPRPMLWPCTICPRGAAIKDIARLSVLSAIWSEWRAVKVKQDVRE